MSLDKFNKALSFATRTKELGELAKSRKAVSNKFTNLFVEKQGVQRELEKLYKPITTAIAEQPKTIVNKIEETNTKIGELSVSTDANSKLVQDQLESLKKQKKKN